MKKGREITTMSGILLNTLAQDLDPALRRQLQNKDQAAACEKYLSELLINDDLLSTDNYTTTNASDKKTLTEEIAELDQLHSRVNAELANVANKNRDLIIDISEDLKAIDTNVGKSAVQELEQISELLTKEGPFTMPVNERLISTINVNNSMLTNIDSVLDILELPTICKLCILQGNYHELLEISMLVQTLVIRFPKLVVFQKIQALVEQELQLMVRGLIKLLNTNLKQNNILKIFQILNKPDLMNHQDPDTKDKFLKMIFLNARYNFITNEIENLKPILKFNTQTYLKRFIEIYREHIFTSLSIYHSIFAKTKDEDPILINQLITNLASLLSKALQDHLPEINSDDEADTQSERDAIILRVLYLCRSLAKYGVDCESIIASDLCYSDKPFFSEQDWLRNLEKVNKF